MPALAIGDGVVVRVTVAVEEQPEVVPVTVYVVVKAGVAVGFAIKALFKLAEGSQLYVVAPLADNGELVPEQIVVEPDAIVTGIVFTVIV